MTEKSVPEFDLSLGVTLFFAGKVLPERANVHLPEAKFLFYYPEPNLKGEAVVAVAASQISIVVKVEHENPHVLTLKNYMENHVRMLIDALGYIKGIGYDVELTSATNSDGHCIVFGVGIEEIAMRENERPLNFEELLEPLNKSPEIHAAMADLREAIRMPLDTGLFCYRAIECIRQYFRRLEDGNDSKRSWQRLREGLRIDESWLKWMTEYSTCRRHGENRFISGEERVKLMLRSWKILDRFIVYVKKDFEQLPEDEYPLLIEDIKA